MYQENQDNSNLFELLFQWQLFFTALVLNVDSKFSKFKLLEQFTTYNSYPPHALSQISNGSTHTKPKGFHVCVLPSQQ